MSAPSLDQLTTPLTLDEVRASIYAVLGTIGVNATTWKPGAVVRTIITAVALVIAAVSRLVALIASSGFLSLSSDAWLAVCAYYTFGVRALDATAATGVVTLNNAGGGVYGPFAPDTVTFSSVASGKLYRNATTFSVGALQTGVVVTVHAVEVGSASTANAGDIANIVSPGMTGVSCANAAAIIGQDGEEDSALIRRAQESLGARSPNGPSDAYAYVARSSGRDATGNPIIITDNYPGTPIGVTRVLPVKDGVGGIDLYMATATGGVTGAVGNLATDLGAVDALLQQYATPIGTTLRSQSATPHSVNIGYEIWLYQSSLTDAQIKDAINTALVSFMPQRPIGGDKIGAVGAVWASAIEVAVGSATTTAKQPLNIYKTVVTPGDIVLSPFEVPVLGTVTTVAIHRTSRAGI